MGKWGLKRVEYTIFLFIVKWIVGEFKRILDKLRFYCGGCIYISAFKR